MWSRVCWLDICIQMQSNRKFVPQGNLRILQVIDQNDKVMDIFNIVYDTYSNIQADSMQYICYQMSS